MADPTRLLSAHSDAERLERALLESLHDLEPPHGSDHDAIWGPLAAQLGALGVMSAGSAVATAAASGVATGAPAALAAGSGAAPAALTGSAGAASAGVVSAAPPALAGAGVAGALGALLPKTLLAKVLVVGALSSAGGTAVWLQRPAPRAASAVPMAQGSSAREGASEPALLPDATGPASRTSATEPTSRTSATGPASRTSATGPTSRTSATEPTSRTSALPGQATPAAPSAASAASAADRSVLRRVRPARGSARHDRLARESALLTSARAALRAGELGTSALLLARLGSEFAQGELVQERQVLEIELLSAQGEAKAASVKARRFMAAHPESPHSEKLARFVQ